MIRAAEQDLRKNLVFWKNRFFLNASEKNEKKPFFSEKLCFFLEKLDVCMVKKLVFATPVVFE